MSVNVVYHCEICDKTYEKRETYRAHLKKFHKELSKENREKIYHKEVYGNRKCKICNKDISHLSPIQNTCGISHRNLLKDIIDNNLDIYTDFIQCELCNEYIRKGRFDAYQHLSKHISDSHSDIITNEQYYLKYLSDKNGKKDSACKWCGKPLKFKSLYNGYRNFCCNSSCNIYWHNKFEDRHIITGNKNKETFKKDPSCSFFHYKYWMKRENLSKDEAKIKVIEVKKKNTFSLKNCIIRYGKEEGLKRFQERQEKWQITLNNKSEEELTRINKAKISTKYSISKAEKELFKIFQENNLDIEQQFSLTINNNKHCLFDFRYQNKLIEYNGDFWHANPKIYNKDFVNKRSHKTAKDIWERDIQRNKIAEENGYKLMTIWEYDFKHNREETINKCLTFLRSKC